MAFATYVSVLILLFRPITDKQLQVKAFMVERVLHSILLGATKSKKEHNKKKLSPSELANGSRLGTDSHAEATCYGRHARVTHVHEGIYNNVRPFHDGYEAMKRVKTVDACFAHDGDDGVTYILHHHYSLDFTDSMEDSILCSNQTRANDVLVDDIPPCFDFRGDSSHSITFPSQDVQLKLKLHNAISYLPVRYLTDNDLEIGVHLNLSSDEPWDPTMFCGNQAQSRISSISNPYHGCDFDDDTLSQDLASLWEETINVSAVSHMVNTEMNAEKLADLWYISIEDAARTLKCTDMDRIRQIKGKIHRRFKTMVHQKRYKQLGGYLSMFASDTFKSNVTSLRGNQYVQLFCNRANYTRCYPIKKKEHAWHALDRFLHEVGVPSEMLTDEAVELVRAEWARTCRKHKIYQVTTEPHSPWQNPAEKNGGLVKQKVKQLMQSTNTPVVCWDYCWEYSAAIRSHVAVNNVLLDDVTPFQKVHGYTLNVTEYTMFKWYQWVWFHDPNAPDSVRLGRWLGPAHNIGQGYCHHILSDKGKVVSRSTVTPVTPAEKATSETQERMSLYTKAVEELIGNFSQSTLDKSIIKGDDPYNHLFKEDYMDDEDIEPQEYDDLGNPITIPDVDEPVNDSAFMEQDDKMIGLRIPIERGGVVTEGKVKSRKRLHDGSLVGTENSNPTLDTRIYNVEFPDGSYNEYSTNVLVENLYSHVDEDGMHHSILKGITDHVKTKDALPISEGTYTDKYGSTRRKITTKGWKLKAEWTDGSTSWIPLASMKESNPVETAQYAKSRGIQKEPAFAWWSPHVLKKANRIIKATKHRKVRKKVKFGVTIPDTVEEALAIDKEEGNDFWKKSIDKEIKNVKVAFRILEEGEQPPVGSKHIPYHIIFDVKFDLTRKSRLVAGGHRNKDVPAHATFSSVTSRDSVRLAFMLAALNNLNILSADIGNAYLNAPARERVHTTLGPEIFGTEHSGKTAVIVRALYGLKTAGAAWRHHFASFIRDELKFDPTVADPDVYRKPMIKKDGTKYYAYLVLYVDDCLAIEEQPEITMNQIEAFFRLKEGVGKPKMYLGTDTKEWQVQNDVGEIETCWAIGLESYLKEAIRTAELNIAKQNMSYSSSKREGRQTPFKHSDYRPELDVTDLCDDEKITLYQNLIGMLRWICELGRIDILHECSILSQYLAQPRLGHLQEAINICYYLKYHNRSWIVMNPNRFDVEWQPRNNDEVHPRERAKAMKELYPDATDELPHNMPEPRGRGVDISVFVDADHAGNRVTRRSHT
jgi:hypothetical protein